MCTYPQIELDGSLNVSELFQGIPQIAERLRKGRVKTHALLVVEHTLG
jgi:hypothetical protein